MKASTKDTLKRVGWTAIQSFIGAVLVLAPGVWSAPDLKTARALGTAAIIAGVAAATSAIKNGFAKPGTAAR